MPTKRNVIFTAASYKKDIVFREHLRTAVENIKVFRLICSPGSYLLELLSEQKISLIHIQLIIQENYKKAKKVAEYQYQNQYQSTS